MNDFKYSIVVVPDGEDGGYYAYVPDLQGCMGDGPTVQDAAGDAIDAAKCWMDAQTERGATLPEPGDEAGRFDAMMQEREDYIAELEEELSVARRTIRELRAQGAKSAGLALKSSSWARSAVA